MHAKENTPKVQQKCQLKIFQRTWLLLQFVPRLWHLVWQMAQLFLKSFLSNYTTSLRICWRHSKFRGNAGVDAKNTSDMHQPLAWKKYLHCDYQYKRIKRNNIHNVFTLTSTHINLIFPHTHAYIQTVHVIARNSSKLLSHHDNLPNSQMQGFVKIVSNQIWAIIMCLKLYMSSV